MALPMSVSAIGRLTSISSPCWRSVSRNWRKSWYGMSLSTLQSQQPLCVAARNGRNGGRVQSRRSHMADRVTIRHVERVVGAHDDMVGAIEPHQFGELMRR